MRALDTNLLIRVVINDDPDQANRAIQAIEAGDTFLSLSVCLEAEWVLRSGYSLSPSTVADVLTKFASIEGMTVERPDLLATAIGWHREGMDFADALHLAVTTEFGCTAMLSFDDRYAKIAAKLGATPVVRP